MHVGLHLLPRSRFADVTGYMLSVVPQQCAVLVDWKDISLLTSLADESAMVGLSFAHSAVQNSTWLEFCWWGYMKGQV